MSVETLILVEGTPMPANLQPSQSALQGAFRKAPGQTPSIVIDMAAALPIARDMVRQARVAAFEKNDAAITIATRRGEDLTALNAKAEALCHGPQDPRLSAAETPDALLAAVEAVIAEF